MKKMKVLSFFCAFFLSVTVLVSPAAALSRSASDILEGMEVEAQAALLVDADTDVIFYEQNAYDKVYPASITKVMTAVCVFRAIEDGQLSLDTEVTAQDDCWDGLDSSSSNANIREGEVMTVEELLYCLLVASANEAANILAEEVSGSIEDFVTLMNETAAELGCTGTNFVNPHGMPDDDHYTTCYDLYLMAKEAMRFDDFCTIVKSKECYIEATNLSEQRHYYNTNGLLSNLRYTGYYYEKCIGIKTGSTDDAGYCLLAAAEEDGQTLISVVMGCENPVVDGVTQRLQFSESSRLLEWGFDNFSTITILEENEPEGTVPVTLSDEADYVTVVAETSLEAQLPNDITADDFRKDINLISEVEAPVMKGDVLGTMTLTLDGTEYGTVNLVAANDVAVSEVLLRKAQLETLVGQWWMKIVFLMAGLILLLVLLRLLVFCPKKKSRYGSSGGSRRGN
ncbi:MAG: D-alanyl-D-alanine carboxypeptidase, partial [Clostridiales bacterium]|nr:D-alanyl-D-alanine carboxypeptidase [Clostridiales bacterium]